MPKSHLLTAAESASRLDKFLSEQLPSLTRSYVKNLIDDGLVLVNDHPAKPSQKLKAGDSVRVTEPDAAPIEVTPQEIPLDVLYEDSDVIVINKPAGLTVHPAPGHPDSTLVNAILARCPDLGAINGDIRPGIVHRLDKDTSGVMVVAKNQAAQQSLAQQFKDRTVEKSYIALATGRVKHEKGMITAALGRNPRDRKKISVLVGGRPSITSYQVVRRYKEAALIEALPKTGRTHQIRAHMASIGHPLVGDGLYGGGTKLLGRQFLHAARLAFTHPRTGQRVSFEAKLPDDLERVLAQLS
ncbi:MAG: RluA family pseudouridine synthase [Chloroflexi bacterium]|nr:RluA family pseudouridine synthase [Chloroflexota bacterium]